MDFIIPIKGNVKYPITMDPSVWIFDDRRLDLADYFQNPTVALTKEEEEEQYKEKMGKFWSREIMEGAVSPPTLQSEKQFERQEEEIKGALGMFITEFIQNAEPLEGTTSIVFGTDTEEQLVVPFEKLDDIILQFSADGKPLREDGPVYVLWKDGSNRHDPFRNVTSITLQ